MMMYSTGGSFELFINSFSKANYAKILTIPYEQWRVDFVSLPSENKSYVLVRASRY